MAFIDFVRWEPGSDPVYAWKFPENNLSTFTQLIVNESQEAVLFSKGQILNQDNVLLSLKAEFFG